MGCPKNVSKGGGDTGFEPVKKEDGDQFKLTQTAITNDSKIKQTTTQRWSVLFEQIGSGTQSVDLRLVLKSLSKLSDSDFTTIKVLSETARLDNLSQFIYGTPYLWWAIRIANFSKFETPFSTIPVNTDLRVIEKEALFRALNAVVNNV
jgi:hypothetical protein